jgi:uncharacterized protein (TIGR02001 family)
MRLALAALIAALAAPAAAADWSGEVGLVSDYRFRGVSLSQGRPVMQADLEIEHGSGLYADLWASTLGEGDPGWAEVDVTAGYAADLGEHIGIDVSAMYYAYPSAPHDNYAEATAKLTATGGDFTAELGASYAPAQRGTGHADNLYLFATADYALPRTAVTLKAGVGYERGAFDEVAQGGKWDWTLGGEVAVKPARLGLAYVGSNAGGGGGHALVASAFLEF